MNIVILIGNTGKDPEIHNTQNSKVAKFSLATTESYKNSQGEKITTTEWHNITCWGKLAEIVEKYVKKGQQLSVTGKLHYDSYTDKEGNKKFTTEIKADTLQMLGGKKEQTMDAEPSGPNEIGDDLPY